MFKKFLSVFLALTVIFCFCACGDDGEDVLIMPIESDPLCLDPQVAESESARLIIENCYEGLVRLDENGKIIPGVAESWSVSADGLSYTFNLRSDSHWKLLNSFKGVLPEDYKESYRTQVIAADFVFALRRALDPNTKAGDAEKLFCIKNALEINSGGKKTSELGVTAKDDQTLVITLSRANPDFLRILTLPVAMPCHEEFFNATHAKYGLDLKYTFCNGPFYLSRWAEDNVLSAYKNDEYKGVSKVKPTEIYFYVNEEESSVIQKIRQRTYDCAIISESAHNELSDNEKISNYSVNSTVNGLCFNCSDSVLSNENLRRALVMATDTKTLLADIPNAFSGGIVPENVRFGETSYREAAGNVSGIVYNAAQASLLWQKGLEELDISSAKVVISCTENDAPKMQEIIQNWQEVFSVSILAKVEIKTDEQIKNMIYNTSYQAIYYKLTASSSTVTDMLKKLMTGSSSNIFGFSDEAYDDTVNAIINTCSGNDILSKCRYAEKIILDKAVFLPMSCSASYAIINKGVEGLYFSAGLDSVCFIKGGHS